VTVSSASSQYNRSTPPERQSFTAINNLHTV